MTDFLHQIMDDALVLGGPWQEDPRTASGLVELVPVDWLRRHANPAPEPRTQAADGRTVTLEDLWRELRETGLRQPVVLRAGRRDRRARLEEGNQRVAVAAAHGVTHLPAVCEIAETGLGDRRNGDHLFAPALIEEALDVPPGTARAPSTVFRDIARLRIAGALPSIPTSSRSAARPRYHGGRN